MTDGRGGAARPLEEFKLLLRDRRAELGISMRVVERSAGLGHTTVSKALMKRPPQEPAVVVLDAVDELDPPDQLRSLLPRRLPEGLVLVLWGRAQVDRSCLKDIALSPDDVGPHLRLPGLDEEALDASTADAPASPTGHRRPSPCGQERHGGRIPAHRVHRPALLPTHVLAQPVMELPPPGSGTTRSGLEPTWRQERQSG